MMSRITLTNESKNKNQDLSPAVVPRESFELYKNEKLKAAIDSKSESAQGREDNHSVESSPMVNVSVRLNLNKSNPYLDSMQSVINKNLEMAGTVKNKKSKDTQICLDSTYLRKFSEKNGGFVHESSKSVQNVDIISELKQKDEDVRDQLSIDMDNLLN